MRKSNKWIFRFLIAAGIAVSGLVFPAYSQVYIGGELTADETYSPVNNPYIVTQDLIVGEDITLTILPGVELLFESGTTLINNGTLIARGSPGERIKFIPKNQLEFPGLWNGIVFNHSKTVLHPDSSYKAGSILSETVISNASYSVTLNLNTNLLIEKTDISTCSFGIYLNEAGYNTIRNCNFSSCNFGIFMANGYANPGNKIYSNLFYQSSEVGIFINSIPSGNEFNSIFGNTINSCNIGMHIGNYGNNGPGNCVIAQNAFIGNKDALKLFQKGNHVHTNYFVYNRNGLICWQSDNNLVTRNLFSGNKLNSIVLAAGSSFNNITYNSFNYSDGGAWVKPDSSRNSVYNSFLYNTICNNNSFSFRYQNTLQGPAQFNNIMHNGDLGSFINLSDSIIHAEYNFWGTSQSTTTDSIIHDLYDDPLLGEVLYTPVLEEILSSAPVPPLRKVIKQLVGNRVVVSWEPLSVADLSGYRVHSGIFQDISFTDIADIGPDTIYNVNDVSINDTIAVTAYDTQADSVFDQPEGHESDFAYAVRFPYAGPDTVICISLAYAIHNASAPGFGFYTWLTSGDGTFEDIHQIETVYYPGPQDYSLGYVYLFLNAEDAEENYTDMALISFQEAPFAFAGSDTLVTADSTLWLTEALASGFEHIKWSGSGDGTFDSDTLVNPVYRPGPADSETGLVTLTMTVYSSCSSTSDTIAVKIDPGYTINGRVHAGGQLAAMSTLNLYVVKNDVVQPLRSGLLSETGSFSIKSLFAGTYYLYAIPDKNYYPDFLPTYFYNDIRWEHAHKLELAANTYDVDIDLKRLNVKLPPGVGSISGYSTMLSGSNESCGDIMIFLYDGQMKNVLDWWLLENGSDFRFRDLPYGEYVLAGEKTGTVFFYSSVITINPSNPAVENIELVCSSAGLKFLNHGGNTDHEYTGDISLYPNPAIDFLSLRGLDNTRSYKVRVINSQGTVQKYFNNVVLNDNNTLYLKSLPSGIYILEIWSNDILRLRRKLVKQ